MIRINVGSFAGAVLWTATLCARAVTIQNIGGLEPWPPAKETLATDLMASGGVVGTSWKGAFWKAFYWEAHTGLQALDGIGSEYSYATACDSANRIIGYGFILGSRRPALLWERNEKGWSVLELPQPDGSPSVHSAFPQAINNRGRIVGYATDFPGHTGVERPLVWFTEADATWRFAALKTLGGKRGQALAVNAESLAAGWSQSHNGSGRPCLWVPNEEGYGDPLELLPPEGASGEGEARAINAAAQVVGQVGERACLWVHKDGAWDGALLPLLAGASKSWATAINNAGIIAGRMESADGRSRAFIGARGCVVDLNRVIDEDSGWVLLSVEALNEKGDLVGKGEKDGIPTAYRLQLDGNELASLARGEPIGRLEPWTLSYVADSDRVNGVFHAAALAPGKPVWKGWSSRYENLVLPPFTPLVVDSQEATTQVDCWGRTMVYEGQSFPSRIATPHADNLLSGPVRLEAEGLMPIGGALCKVSSSPTRMDACASFENESCVFTNTVWAEYDGVLFHQVDLLARRPLRNLRLIIPIQRSFARFLHWTVAGYGEGDGATMDLDKDLALPFKPVVWIGDYEQGLCWFAENRNHWGKTGSDRPIRVKLDETTCHLEILLGDRVEPGERIRIDFGLLATPVKPLPDNYPFDIFGDFSREKHLGRPELLKELNGTGVRVFAPQPFDSLGAGFWDSRLDHTGEQRLDTKLAEALQTYHVDRGYEIQPYFGPCVLPEDYPESQMYRQDWERLPVRHFRYTRQRDGQTVPFLNCWFCPNSEARDFFVWGIVDLLKRFPEVGGLYFDFGPARACSNARHGCEPNSYAILGMRRFYRALAAELYQTGKHDYAITVHNSDSMQIPALTFVTHLFNGERFRAQSSPTIREDRDYLDGGVPPAVFSVEMSSLPWGITSSMYTPTDPLLEEYQGDAPAEAFSNRLYRLSRSAMTGTLIHGSIPAIWRFHPEYAKRVLEALASFDVRGAEFLPYWRNAEFFEDIPSAVRVSLYRKAGGACLLVVANLDAAEREVTFGLRLEKLGLPPDAICAELMGPRDARLLQTGPGRIALSLQGHAMALVRIGPVGSFDLPRFDPSVEQPVRRPSRSAPAVAESSAKDQPSRENASDWTGPAEIPAPLDETQFRLEIPRLSASPQLDGHIDAVEWEGAAAFPFPIESCNADGVFGGEEQTVRIGYDQDCLYVAMQSGFSRNSEWPPRSSHPGLVRPDHVLSAPESFCLWLGRPGSAPWGFAGTPSGDSTAWHGRDAGRIDAWSYRDSIETTIFDTQVWHAEFAIPLKTLGIENADGAEMTACFVRRRRQSSAAPVLSAWPSARDARDVPALGRLQLSPTAPAFVLTQNGDLSKRELSQQVVMRNTSAAPYAGTLEWETEMQTGQRRPLHAKTIAIDPAEGNEAQVQTSLADPETRRLWIKLRRDGTVSPQVQFFMNVNGAAADRDP